MRTSLLLPVLCALVLLCGAEGPAAQNVRLQNGNFSISYVDVALEGGPRRPILQRTYNSQSGYRGMFGAGWSSEPETTLRPLPDGSVLVLEYGGGRENRFVSPASRPVSAQAMVTRIVAAAMRAGALAPADVPTYRKRLLEQAEYRSDEWAKLLAAGFVTAPDVPAGAVFRSDTLGEQGLVRTASGYRRIDASGDVFDFDRAGRLVRIGEAGGGSVRFQRDTLGRVASIVENDGRSTRLAYNARGLVERVTAPDGREARYRYNERDELIWSEDIDGHRYGFFYDPAGRHNLVEVAYADGTTLAIGYLTGEQGNRVATLREPDGSFATYGYEDDARAGRRLVTQRATRAGAPSPVVTQHEYRWRDDGTQWLYEERVTIDGVSTRRVRYHARCGRERIEEGDRATVVHYGPHCEVLQVERGRRLPEEPS